MLKAHIISGCRFLLLPIVRFLLKHGVSFAEFADVAKEAYVIVARADYGVQGRPTNNSRVSLLTGLSRREVSRVRDRVLEDKSTASNLEGNRLSRVLSGWHSDPEFLDDKGTPLQLPVDGSRASLTALLKRYAGDVPHGAVRKELQQRQLIEALDDGRVKVLRRDFIYASLDPDIVRRMSSALHDHAATLEHNLDEQRQGPRRFEGVADNLQIPAGRYREFHDYVEVQGLAFLEDIDAWLSGHEVDGREQTDANTIRLGVGAYLIYDESDKG